MSKKILITILFTTLISVVNVRSQPYQTGLGLRLGGISSGITVRHFVSGTGAFEGIASFGRHAFLITGLYESFHEFPNAEGLNWFYGGGIHIGFFDDSYHYEYFYYESHGKKKLITEEHNLSFGGDFIIGLDYKFRNAPVNLSLDVKPLIDFAPGVYGYWEGALSVRFTL